MRTTLGLGFLVAVSLAGCNWTDFDDLEKETWARSSNDPDLNSSDFAVAIVGVSTGSSGGTLAVVSDDSAKFSTIDYNSKGGSDVGSDVVDLSDDNIAVLQETPVFVTDGTGRIGLVEKSLVGGNYSVVFGTTTAPGAIPVPSNSTGGVTPAPDAGFYAGDTFVFAAGDTFFSVPSTGGAAIACRGVDAAGMPLQVAGMTQDGTSVWVWTKGGALIAFDSALLSPCASGMIAPLPGSFSSINFMPASGAHVFVDGKYAILAGHAATSRSGEVTVVDTTTFAQVGETLVIEGLASSLVADFGTGTYFVAGIPDKKINKVAAGAVELYAYTAASGTLAATPAATLHDADPESGQKFGRTITTMQFNGAPVLVVGADSEVFAYFKTSLYDHLP